MSESTLLRPNSYYAVAKSAQTQLACYIAHAQQKPIVTIRFFSVFGPYESPAKLFPTLFNVALTNSTIKMASRASAHDFVYIDDVVAGLLCIDVFSKLSGEIYNFGSGIQTSLEQVITTAESVTKQPLTVIWQNTSMHRWDSTHWVADISKVKKTIPWQPRSFNDGLKMYWNWYKKHASLYAEVI
jgi:nucleoside-diphosphate-sugar epimerase